jgi:hypothetical protein
MLSALEFDARFATLIATNSAACHAANGLSAIKGITHDVLKIRMVPNRK